MSHFIIKNSRTIITALTLITSFAFSGVHTVHAATATDGLSEALSHLEALLKTKLTEITPTPQVQGATTVVVSNDTELFNALRDATGGETIQLKPGNYSRVVIREDQYNQMHVGSLSGKRLARLSSPVTITSADAANRAVMRSIALMDAPKWRVEAISFRPIPKERAIEVTGDNVVITKNDITYGEDKNWTADQWNNTTGDGIYVRWGDNVEVSYNYLKNVNFGIAIAHGSDNARVLGNTIDSFNGDGMRGLGDNGLFENNIIKNAVQTNGNHSDGFQSWRDYANNDRPVKGVTLRHNTFINMRTHPLSAAMQGIGMFDGPFEGWTIENNLVAIDHWHGISVYGGVDTVVRNNLVVDVNNVTPGPPWIMIRNTKTDLASTNSRVENNVATQINNFNDGVTYTNNTVIKYSDYSKYFVDYANGDWTVKSGVLPFSVGANASGQIPLPPPPPPTPVPPPDPNPDPTPTPTPTTPTLTFNTNKTNVTSGETVTLTWSATNANTCMASNGWDGARSLSGNETLLMTAKLTFVLKCSNSVGSVEKSITVTVGAPKPIPDTLPPVPGDEPLPTTGIVTIYTTQSVDVYNSAITKVRGTQKTGAKGTYDASLTPRQKSGKEWIKVNFASGVDGYIEKTEVTTTAPLEGYTLITTDNVNVRSAPGGSILTVAPAGSAVTVVSDDAVQVNNFTWKKVTLKNGVTGYVATAFLKEQAGTTDTAALIAKIKSLQEQIAKLLLLLNK